MKVLSKRSSVYGALAIAMLFAFNNCGQVSFSSLQQENLSKAAGQISNETEDSDTSDLGNYQVDNTLPSLPLSDAPSDQLVATPPAPVAETSTPIAVNDGSGMCGFPFYPLSLDRKECSQGAPEIYTGQKAAGKDEVYVFSMYNTANETHGMNVTARDNLPLDRYSSRMGVTVPGGSSKIILVLSAYEPTEWIITGETSRVSKVILIGYYCQTASGVSNSIVESRQYVDIGLNTAISIGNQVAQSSNALLAKAVYTYEGRCVNRNFITE